MFIEQPFALVSMHQVYMAINKTDYTSDFMNLVLGGKDVITATLLMRSLRSIQSMFIKFINL